jgi:hypothetical protein
MSVYSVVSTDRNIFNLPKEVNALDVNTRAYSSVVIGENAAGNSTGLFNTIIGTSSGSSNSIGNRNVFLGAFSAQNNSTGDDNVIIGTQAAQNLRSGRRNVIIGGKAGFWTNGNNNIYIGYTNTFDNNIVSYSNLAMGYNANVFGNNNISFGNNSYMRSEESISVGNLIQDASLNSILIGANIINSGSNSLIINNRHNSNASPVRIQNTEDGYMNINDYIVVSKDSNGDSTLYLMNDIVKILASNIDFSSFGGRLLFGDTFDLSGRYSRLLLDQEIRLEVLGGTNDPRLIVGSNIYLGGDLVSSFSFVGSNTSFYLSSNIVSLSNLYNEVYISSNIIEVGGDDNKVITLYGSNNSFTMCNGGTYLDSDLLVYGTTYLSDTLTVDSTSTFKDNAGFYDDVVFHSNVTLQSNIIINSNASIFFKGDATISNNNVFAIKGTGQTRIEQDVITSNNYVQGKMSFCNVQQGYKNWENVSNTELQELYGSTIIQKNLFVGGMMYSAGLNVADRFVIGSGQNQWSQYVEVTSNMNPSLVFDSGTGTTIKLDDEFSPELINFTGKHRCKMDGQENNISCFEDIIGRIVVATGDYNNLQDKGLISIDESIPIITLSTRSMDTRAFGVICDKENGSDKRIFKLGHFQFEMPKAKNDIKTIVNSVGEGGIWVCNANGNFRNGDLIVTSDLPGYGMKQNDDVIRSYTVAKITCDCTFDDVNANGSIRNDVWKPTLKIIKMHGTDYKIAFVGCVYKF